MNALTAFANTPPMRLCDTMRLGLRQALGAANGQAPAVIAAKTVSGKGRPRSQLGKWLA